MSEIVRKSTARTIIVGPVLNANGVAVTGAAVGDFKIAKNGDAPGSLDGSATLTHRHTGHYSLALTANDIDTVGTAEVTLDKSTDACGPKVLTVIEDSVYDAMFAASAAFPANFADLGINSSGHISRVTLVDTTTANTDMRGTDNALLAASYIAPANSDITAIKAKTDNLPASPAAQGKLDDVESRLTATRAGYLDNLNVTGTLANTDNANTFKADVSGLSTFNAASDQVTVATNNDKTGYTLTQDFPPNFADLTVNGSGHVVLQDGSLTTAKLGSFELAKGTNLTGLNDIAATAVVSDGAITTSGGAVSNVTTVATTTNLTNLPTIPNDWITAAGINNGALTAAKFATGAFDAVWTVGTRTLTSFGTLITDTVAAVFDRVLSKANHNTPRSAGRMIREVWQSQTLQDGEAQGGTSNTITLASTATTVCLFQAIVVENSSGVRQCRFIVDFDDSTKVATVGSNWCVTPEAGDDYLIIPLRDELANVPNGFYPSGSIAERIVDTLDGVDSANVKLDTIAGDAGDTLETISQQIAAIPTTIRVKKNTALPGFTFPMVDQDDELVTGLTVTSQRILDGVAIASTENAVTEVASGFYAIDLEAADLNGDNVVLRFSATGAKDTVFVFVTQP